MVFEAFRPWQLYSGQTTIPLPKKEVKFTSRTEPDKTSESSGGAYKVGTGNIVFLVTPNIAASQKLLVDPSIKFVQSTYHYYSIDGRYKGRVGKKQLVKNESVAIKKQFDTLPMPLTYVMETNRKTYLNQNKNLVIDLSRWMDLYFTYSFKNSAKSICQNFITFFAEKLNSSDYDGYQKTIFLDMNSWVGSSDECIVMNKALLTNPLAILFYACYYYPEMLSPLKGMNLYLVNRATSQIFITKTDDLTKKLYPKLKPKVMKLSGLKFSAMDETNETEDLTEQEVVAEIRQEFKEKLVKSMKSNLLGTNSDAPDIEDITTEFDDEPEELPDLSPLDEGPEDDNFRPDEIENTSIPDEFLEDIEEIVDADEVIEKGAEQYLKDNPEAIEEDTPDEIAKKLTPDIKKKAYISTFMPQRTEEEIIKLERLVAGQNAVVAPPTYDDVKSKVIQSEDLSKYIKTSNPDIIKGSKYQNFDRGYVDKKMEADIDNAVSILSRAEHPIFIVGKESEDTSTPLDLKKTMIYSMEDENGNKFKLKFDVPIVIDGNYVYLNGTKKIISHQFLLKPIAKTGSDTVQLVSFYLKIFIYRLGIVDQNTNFIHTYLGNNAEEFKVRPGNASLKNKKYETSLDHDMIAKRYYSFELNGIIFIQEIDALIAKGQKLNPEIKLPNLKKEIPIGYIKKTKEFLTIPHGASYTDQLISLLTEAQMKELAKITRKPKLIMAKMKLHRKLLPVMLFMLYCEGFKSCMEKAGIRYEFIDKKEKKSKNPLQWGFIDLADCTIAWEKSPMSNSLLMNGILEDPFDLFTREELESKDTYGNLITRYYDSPSILLKLDQAKEFFIDDASREVLMDYGYPTDLVSLLVVAVRMLCDNKYKAENAMSNCRIRSPEVVANLVYTNVTNAYYNYRRTSYKKKPMYPTFKQTAIIDDLLSADVRMLEESSYINPVWSLEKTHAVTFKGIRGIQLDRAMTLPRRGYDESMLGVCGISTSPKQTWVVVQ